MKFPLNWKIPAITTIVAASVTLSVPAAHADLRVHIFDDLSTNSLKITVIGKLDTLPSPLAPPHPDLFACGVDGLLTQTSICTGPGGSENLNLYEVDGGVSVIPMNLVGLENANSVIGSTFTLLTADNPYPSYAAGILDGYVAGTPFFSSATFNGESLSSIGLAPGLVGVWNLIGTSEKITVLAEPVPGPLPLIGAASAYAFSRRLRSRILSPKVG
jgi:hypothetical protein